MLALRLAIIEGDVMTDQEQGTRSAQVIVKVQDREDLLPLSEKSIRGVFSLLGLETADDRLVFCAMSSAGQIRVVNSAPAVTIATNSTVIPNVEEAADA